MRKAGIVIFALFLMYVSGITVFAGTINPEEARVIDAASGYFDYLGQDYVATESSLSQMTAYLNQDSVDLTEVQANRAIQLMRYEANIKTAIDDGYLVPVNGGGGTDPGTDPGTDGDGTGGGDGDGTGGDGNGDGISDPDDQPGEDPVKSGFVEIMFREGVISAFDSEDNLVFSGGLPVKTPALIFQSCLFQS